VWENHADERTPTAKDAPEDDPHSGTRERRRRQLPSKLRPSLALFQQRKSERNKPHHQASQRHDLRRRCVKITQSSRHQKQPPDLHRTKRAFAL